MANFSDLIGIFMQNAMAPSGASRVGSALEQLQRGGFGGVGGAPGGTPPQGGGAGDLFGGILDMVKGGLQNAAQNPGQAGGLGALAGALLGGGKGAVGGGALAMLTAVAIKAMQGGGDMTPAGTAAAGAATPAGPLPAGAVQLGVRPAQNVAEEEALEATARLILKGMINAAKSDGQISPQEMQHIVGKLQESGAERQLQQWVMDQMTRPLDVQAFAAEIPNQQVAAQVYAASLLAIEVDTDAERQYLEQFAREVGLHPLVVGQIHQTLGVMA